MWSDPIFINNLIVPIAGMLTGIVLGLPIVKAAVRYFEHKHGMRSAGADKLEPAVKEILDRLDLIEERLEGRLSEVEERVDFTERVLTQHRERSALPGSE